MYVPLEKLRSIGQGRARVKKFNTLPYFLCEYGYSASTGPGSVEDYWKVIYSYDGLLGGCIWEMCDHAVLEKNGDYTYGGDHGEWEHDGTVCVNGLFLPDRTPSDSARVVAHAYRPIRVRHLGGNEFEIFNTTGFTHGSNYLLEFKFNDGRKAVVTPDVKPMQEVTITVQPHGKEKPADIRLLTVETYAKLKERTVCLLQVGCIA